MKESNMLKADFVTSIILMVFSISIVVLSIRMPRMEELGANPFSAPGIVPGFLGVIIFILSLILLIRSFLKKGYQLDVSQKTITSFFKEESTIRVILTVLMSVIYGALLLGRIPYILATFLYVMVFIMIFEYQVDKPFQGQRKTVLFSFIQAVLVAGIVAAVFRYLFLVKLP